MKFFYWKLDRITIFFKFNAHNILFLTYVWLSKEQFSPRLRFVSPVTKSQYISDQINISFEHSGDILVSVNFNAFIKSRFFNSCFTLWPSIFGYIFSTHKHLINLILELSIFYTFNSYSFIFITPSVLLKNI